MSIDSRDAPPPPPPPPPPDYSAADEPVTDDGPAPPDSTPSAGAETTAQAVDAAGVNGAPGGADGLAAADAPVVDEGQATPDLADGPDAGPGPANDLPPDADATSAGSADLPAGPPQDAPATDQPMERQSWEAAGDDADLPPSMREDLSQLGQDLKSDVDPDAWAKGDQEDRAAMLADANDRIRETYGLPPGEVNYSSDLPEGCTGQYNPGTGDITLNSSLLEDQNPDEAIQTLSHENFHDYQQQAIDGNAADPYAESRADAWTAGQDGYDAEDFTAYMANPLEADAFAAERAVIDGYRRQ
jgi:hypothetical protein